MKKLTISLALFGATILGFSQTAQQPNAEELAKQNWFHANFATDSIYGTASGAAHDLAKAKGLKPTSIIVAVLDSGVDIEHEDLKNVLWTNKDEIAGNGIDDDKNGYIDDVHGWNFIGGADGQNVDVDNLEITRLVRSGMELFENNDESVNLANQKKFPEQYEQFKKNKIEVEQKLASAKMQYSMIEMQINQTLEAFNAFSTAYGEDKEITQAGLEAFQPQDEFGTQLKTSFLSAFGTEKEEDLKGRTPKQLIAEIQSEIEKDPAVSHFKSELKQYDVTFDPRNIVGDNYADKTEKYYGNNDVDGPDSFHGTHVAGIIGAQNGNNLGIDGIARNVEIMSVRTVPNGDERDKDVANAIRYAVDNGAKIINMSFGKAFSPEKDIVWDAIKYATDKNVLLVHAAGNDNKDIDTESNYPTNYKDGKEYSNTWLTVGASSRYNNAIKASFSNFGKEQVDIFAPGLEIYSTVPESEYDWAQGTSMAAPAVSGVAALVWSYYPRLTAQQLRKILMDSGNETEGLLDQSKNAKTVDALKALQLASELVKK